MYHFLLKTSKINPMKSLKLIGPATVPDASYRRPGANLFKYLKRLGAEAHSELIKLLFSIKILECKLQLELSRGQIRWLYLAVMYVSGGNLDGGGDNDQLTAARLRRPRPRHVAGRSQDQCQRDSIVIRIVVVHI